MQIKKFIPTIKKSKSKDINKDRDLLERVHIAAGSIYAMTTNREYLYVQNVGLSKRARTATKKELKGIKHFDIIHHNGKFINKGGYEVINYDRIIKDLKNGMQHKHIDFKIPREDLAMLIKQAGVVRGEEDKNLNFRLSDEKLECCNKSDLGEYQGFSDKISITHNSPEIFAHNWDHLKLINKIKSKNLRCVMWGPKAPICVHDLDFNEILFISSAPTDSDHFN